MCPCVKRVCVMPPVSVPVPKTCPAMIESKPAWPADDHIVSAYGGRDSMREHRGLYHKLADVPILGEGSFGTVAVAKSTLTGCLVAMKSTRLVRGTIPPYVQNEIRALRILYPAWLHDVTLSPGTVNLVTDIAQCDLARLMKRGPAPHSETVFSRAHEIFAGLAHIHAHGIMHRDLSPSNILVRRDGCAPSRCSPGND